MKITEAFKAVGALVSGAKAREDEAHNRFLAFYRELVETLPTDVCRAFGTLNGVKLRGALSSTVAGIQLNAADFIWWQRNIAGGARFVDGVSAVQMDMLDHLTKKAEVSRLEPDERKALLAVLDEAHSASAAPLEQADA